MNNYKDTPELSARMHSPLMERIVELKENFYAEAGKYDYAPKDLADAMDARCYRGGVKRSRMNPLKYRKGDYAAYAMLVLYAAAIISLGIYAKSRTYGACSHAPIPSTSLAAPSRKRNTSRWPAMVPPCQWT